jgi:hypothetical protein
VFKPFSKRAACWEEKAVELRRKLPVRGKTLLDPGLLAPEVGLAVVDANDFLPTLSAEARNDLFGRGSKCWSGGVLPQELPDGRKICIINPIHCHERNNVTLMEEICHIFLGHRPSTLTFNDGGFTFRGFDKEQEDDAYGVGAAALLPWATFYHCLDKSMSATAIAAKYEVSVPLADYRIKICGASNLYRSRQRRTAGAP